jgi:hypothetical protein
MNKPTHKYDSFRTGLAGALIIIKDKGDQNESWRSFGLFNM